MHLPIFSQLGMQHILVTMRWKPRAGGSLFWKSLYVAHMYCRIKSAVFASRSFLFLR